MATSVSLKPGGGMARYRWAVASRTLAAGLGGYGLAAAATAALALLFAAGGMPRPDAVMAATLLGFVVHAVAAMWAFGCASAWRAWAGILLPFAALGLLGWWLAGGGAP